MSDILTIALALAHAADPDHDHTRMATAIASVVAVERPLYAGDDSRERTLALVTAVAWREGSLRERVEGDCDQRTKDGVCIAKPHSYCTAQIHDTSGGTPALNDDPELCIRTEIAMLRTSIAIFREAPVAFYAAGPKGYKGERARRISNDRVALAGRLLVAARAAIAEDEARERAAAAAETSGS